MAVPREVEFSLLLNNVLEESVACFFIFPGKAKLSSYALLLCFKFIRVITASAMRTPNIIQVN
jgi:hypothetical protein